MKISIIGGTGGMGEGLALRWSLNHDILIGSRDPKRAEDAAASYMKIASEKYKGMKGSIKGGENGAIAKECDLLILSIPYENIDDICSRLEVNERCIIVSPIVPMRKGADGFEYIPLHEEKRSAVEMVASRMPPRSRIVSALHTISEVKLKHLDEPLDCDAFVCGDDPSNVKIVSTLLNEINGLRAVYLGPLSLSYQAEILTPMLLNAAKQNKIKHPGIKIV